MAKDIYKQIYKNRTTLFSCFTSHPVEIKSFAKFIAYDEEYSLWKWHSLRDDNLVRFILTKLFIHLSWNETMHYLIQMFKWFIFLVSYRLTPLKHADFLKSKPIWTITKAILLLCFPNPFSSDNLSNVISIFYGNICIMIRHKTQIKINHEIYFLEKFTIKAE